MIERTREMMTMLNCKELGVALLFIFMMVFGHTKIAFSQNSGDPTVDPIPTLDLDTSDKSIVVRIHFFKEMQPEVESVEIVPGPNHARAGNPPYLNVSLYGLSNNNLEEFYSWPPLWSFAVGDPGSESVVELDDAYGSISFPFRNDVSKMVVTDVDTQNEVVSVDLIPGLHNSCRANPGDHCTNIVNRLPICDANGPYSVECAGETTYVELVGNNSSDLDLDLLFFSWSGPFAGSPASIIDPTVQFSGYGNFSVNLTVSDDFGGETSCSSSVAVIDTQPPTIQCNTPATITPTDAPISFQATASDTCVGSITATITGFDCFTHTKKGKRIDKTESCQVAFTGNTVTINDSGGVDDYISWSVVATDDSGNTSTTECGVAVVNPSPVN